MNYDPPNPVTPILLRIPAMRTPADVLNTALRMNLANCIVLSLRDNGDLVWLCTDDATVADVNWLLDCAKRHLHT